MNAFHSTNLFCCFSRYQAPANSVAPPSLYKPHTTHNSSIRSDEGLTLETSAFESLYGSQFTLSTQLIKPNYLAILPPTQYHSFFRNLPPLFVLWKQMTKWVGTSKPLTLRKLEPSEIASYKNRDCKTQIFITAKKRDCETREIWLRILRNPEFLKDRSPSLRLSEKSFVLFIQYPPDAFFLLDWRQF